SAQWPGAGGRPLCCLLIDASHRGHDDAAASRTGFPELLFLAGREVPEAHPPVVSGGGKESLPGARIRAEGDAANASRVLAQELRARRGRFHALLERSEKVAHPLGAVARIEGQSALDRASHRLADCRVDPLQRSK